MASWASSWCTAARATPIVISSVKETYYSTPWHTVVKPNSQDASASQDAKASKPANSSQTSKVNKAKAPTAAKIATNETDVNATLIPKKHQKPARSLKVKSAAISDFQILSALLATLKVIYHTYSLKEEREFRAVLRRVTKALPIEEVNEDLIIQNLPVQSRARCVKCLGDHGTKAFTRNKVTDGPPACVFCKSAGHTANYLGCSRAPKRQSTHKVSNNKKAAPPVQIAPCRATARAVTGNLSYAKATARFCKNPSTNSAPKNSSTEDIKALMSMISVIDIGEIALLAKKSKAAANPVEKILLIAEHAPLVEAIKNNKM
ncbi:hypothetical protein EVAR_28936_1 [Eumeta japonica]|uniref:Nucleic-acid-binding protein from transposon X-element n=1 Tax=Eumeta variegata TaxID=151549 RepID=A0A4C1VY74_EUMVA|nr:hypothetical protein EVAR_28936_1 [Eumeta japonica]